jgi:hypothetical protein
MTTEDANNYLNSLSQADQRILESIADKWYAVRDKTQELLVESGQETQETIDLWRELFPDYVPLNREQEQQAVPAGMRTGAGVDVRGNFAKRAMGSEKAIINPIDALMYQRERAIARAENNNVGKAVYRLALENPNPDFWMAINPDAIHSREKLIQELTDMCYANAEEIEDNIKILEDEFLDDLESTTSSREDKPIVISLKHPKTETSRLSDIYEAVIQQPNRKDSSDNYFIEKELYSKDKIISEKNL